VLEVALLATTAGLSVKAPEKETENHKEKVRDKIRSD